MTTLTDRTCRNACGQTALVAGALCGACADAMERERIQPYSAADNEAWFRGLALHTQSALRSAYESAAHEGFTRACDQIEARRREYEGMRSHE